MNPFLAYQTDAVFKLLVDEWVKDRQCPAPLVDRCLELEMPLAAAAARWASTEPLRAIDDQRTHAPGTLSYPYPGYGDGARYSWVTIPAEMWPEGDTNHLCSRYVPSDCVTGQLEHQRDPLQSILWLLDNWIKP